MEEADLEDSNLSELYRKKSEDVKNNYSAKKKIDVHQSVEHRFEELKDFYIKNYQNNIFLKALIKNLNLPDVLNDLPINDKVNSESDRNFENDTNSTSFDSNNNVTDYGVLKNKSEFKKSGNKFIRGDKNLGSDDSESIDAQFSDINLDNDKAIGDYDAKNQNLKEKLSNSSKNTLVENTNSSNDWIQELKEDLFYDKCSKDMNFLDRMYRETMKNAKIDKIPSKDNENIKSAKKKHKYRKHHTIDADNESYTWTMEKINPDHLMEMEKQRDKHLEEKVKKIGDNFWIKKLGGDFDSQ